MDNAPTLDRARAFAPRSMRCRSRECRRLFFSLYLHYVVECIYIHCYLLMSVYIGWRVTPNHFLFNQPARVLYLLDFLLLSIVCYILLAVVYPIFPFPFWIQWIANLIVFLIRNLSFFIQPRTQRSNWGFWSRLNPKAFAGLWMVDIRHNELARDLHDVLYVHRLLNINWLAPHPTYPNPPAIICLDKRNGTPCPRHRS